MAARGLFVCIFLGAVGSAGAAPGLCCSVRNTWRKKEILSILAFTPANLKCVALLDLVVIWLGVVLLRL